MLRRARFPSIPVLVLAMTVPALTADKSTTFLDPADAGPDFAVQGEYAGKIPTDDGPVGYGVQVIALGGGKFQAVGYPGGLPGAGWDKSEKVSAEGATVDGVTTFEVADDKNVTVAIKGGVLTVTGENGKQIAALKKIERKSPTLGAKPPAGAVVLFDGKTPDNFQGGQMTSDGLLMVGATSKQKFQSFTLHIEFRTPFKPTARGQGRGNSGFYAQGRYEVQILDSFGLEGRDNECGGIYSVGPPDVNMCFPPLSWQTYDVDFETAQFKDGKKVKDAVFNVRHNGVLIHKDRIADHSTTASPLREGPEPGPIFLQNHGNPVRFRNIWVVEK
ncbi:MAG: DUF1080 domain-containing protein [Thermoguttaceae bacterium]